MQQVVILCTVAFWFGFDFEDWVRCIPPGPAGRTGAAAVNVPGAVRMIPESSPEAPIYLSACLLNRYFPG